MSRIRINIIGGGIGGLFSGALLAKHGFEVKVFEANSKPGGFATSWKRGDFLFDSSLHEINGFFPDDKKLRHFRFLRLFDRIKLMKVTSPYTSVFRDFEFTVPHNFEMFVDKLIREFPHEKDGITSVMNKLKNLSTEAGLFMNEKNRFEAYKNTPVKYKTILKNLFNTVHKVVWKEIKTPKLRTIISQLYLYYSDDIRKLNIIYFSAPTYSYFNQSFWISGTSSSLTSALVDIITENGGEVFTGKKVTGVIFEKKKAAGIVLEDGAKHYSDITICNSPLKHTVKNIIGYKNMPLHLSFIASKTVPSTSIFSLYIGMDIDVRKLGFNEYCYILNDTDEIHVPDRKNHMQDYKHRPLVIVGFNLDRSLCPPGKTVVNISITDRPDYWKKYRDDRKRYREEKERIARIILDRVEVKFPGFQEHIEVMEIGTPLTMEKYSGNTDGAVYGACQRISQSNMFRFPNEIKKRNLYFSSAWVTPGGGLSGTIISAINVAGLILKRYGIENQADEYIHPIPQIEAEVVN